ncbi:MAG: hypothetical protein RLO52_45195 [Sandaracinaceae bacterium]
MRIPRVSWATVMVVGSLMAACGGAPSSAGPSTAPSEIPSDELPAPPVAWEEMDGQARAQWMYAEVAPRMAERFEGFDEARFSDVSCETCHGPDAEARDFAMPSPTLPPLPPQGSPEAQALHEAQPEIIAFMSGEVVPTMRALLGKGDDFSCGSCHPHAE